MPKFLVTLHKNTTKEISCDRFAVSEGIAIFEANSPMPYCVAAYPKDSWHGVVCIEPPVIPPAMLEAMAAAKALAETPVIHEFTPAIATGPATTVPAETQAPTE